MAFVIPSLGKKTFAFTVANWTSRSRSGALVSKYGFAWSEIARGFCLVPALLGLTLAENFCTDWIARAGDAKTARAVTAPRTRTRVRRTGRLQL